MRPRKAFASRLALAVALIASGAVAGLVVAGTPAARAARPAAATGDGGGTGSPVGSEVRAVWISNAFLGRAGPGGVVRLLDRLQVANVNVVFPEAVFRGLTLYPGPYQDPRFAAWPEDPLELIAREAGRRGMEVHPWVWVFAGGLGSPGPVLAAHPGWAECPDELGGSGAASGRSLWLSPALPAVRKFLMEEFLSILSRYPVQGIHLDYVRYGDGSCRGVSASAARYRDETGMDAPAAGTSSAAADWQLWQEAQVTAFVRDLALAVRAVSPDLIVSAAVIPEIREARHRVRQNWEHWLVNGWIDFAVPMAYASHLPLLREMLASIEDLGPRRSRIVPGLLVSAGSPEQFLAQIETVRSSPWGGVALFAADYLLDEHFALLQHGPFAAAATIPGRDSSGGFARPHLPDQVIPPRAPPVFATGPAYDRPSRPNLARWARVAVDSSFPGYGPGPLTDGRLNDELEIGRWTKVAWASAEIPQDHWIELAWDNPHPIDRVDMYWARDRDKYRSSREYVVEVWTDLGWQAVFHHLDPDGRSNVARHSASFLPVVTDRLRIRQPAGGGPAGRPDLMWIAEVEVYGGG